MQDKEPEEFRENTSIFQIWLLFRKNTIALFSFYLLTLLILTALFSGWIAPYAHNMQFVGQELMPPSWVEKGQIAFFFGTDDLGRDVLSRLIMGTSYTIGSSLIVVLAVALIGGTLGIVAGMLKGLKARFVGHIFDAFFIAPYFAHCHRDFHSNGTEFIECNVCNTFSDITIFHPCNLSSHSTRIEKRLRTHVKT